MQSKRAFVPLLFAVLLIPAAATAQPAWQLTDTVRYKPVDIWSEGTRMAGDLYWPADAADGTRLPAIVMSHGWAHLDKVLEYRPVEDAHRISIPLLVIDAEHEELFDRHQAGKLAVERAKANGARAEYRVIPEISHYGIYRKAFEESALMALDWFNGCLKP